MMRYGIHRVNLLFMVLPLLFACGKTSDFDICNPQGGRFVKGTHYINSELITEDSRFDYLQWDFYRRKSAEYATEYDCIPVAPQKKLLENIEEEENTIDLLR